MTLYKNKKITAFIIALALVYISTAYAEDEPSLPSGLEDTPLEREPILPMGLEDTAKPEEPLLPEGLEIDQPEESSITAEREESTIPLPFDFAGFWEARVGTRTQKDPHEKDLSIGETRLQLQFEKSLNQAIFNVTTDFLFDPVLDRHEIRLEEGEGIIDLREANFLIRPAGFMDIKAGRQTLTWGTGDLIFVNDLFPKDWNSFFIGRDPEYLKAPSNAVKFSFFSGLVNLDVIYTPRFDADRFIDGKRISFFNSGLGLRSGREAVVTTDKRDKWFNDDEISWRFYNNLDGYELAVYGYQGFWKSPAGEDPVSGSSTFPVLSVYGGSIRGPAGKGIGNLELGYYISEDDKSGDNSFIRNSEFRLLAGYEQEAAKDFTVGAQYYLEHIMHYNIYLNSLPSGSPVADENRHVLTLRLTKLLFGQNLMLSLFTFYSPSDKDAYLRPKISFKIDDYWTVESGGNLFMGKEDHTFFGQFENNNNLYVGIRYGF